MTGTLVRLLELLLRRQVKLDPGVTTAYLVQKAVGLTVGLLRGAIATRRKIVLGRGSRINAPRKLNLGGGVIRIEDFCLVDCLSHDGIHLGRNFKLGACSRIVASGTLTDLGRGVRIGDNVGIGEFAYIGGAGGVSIGSDTIVGQYFSVHPENHIFEDPTRLIRQQGVTRMGIEIGLGCWIGAKVTITDGVTIGNHCVIAAGSVVTKNFPERSVIGGVPAQLIRSITPDAG